MAESGSSGATAETTPSDPNMELLELKVKCGNYAEKCMTLMQEHQAKETTWKERERAMIKKLEDALRAIKLLKAKSEAVESQAEIGATHMDLQNKIELASLQKKNQTLTLDLKSLQSQLDMKSTLESKKSKLVELLDLKLSEKGKLVDLMKLKLSQKDAKVALCEARMAQLDKIKCEMALRLEIFRQQLKKQGIDHEPFEVEMARKRALARLANEKKEGQEPGNNSTEDKAESKAPADSSAPTPESTDTAPTQESTEPAPAAEKGAPAQESTDKPPAETQPPANAPVEPASQEQEQKSATPAEPQVVTEPLVDELANVQPRETSQQPASQSGENSTEPANVGTSV